MQELARNQQHGLVERLTCLAELAAAFILFKGDGASSLDLVASLWSLGAEGGSVDVDA
jgi:hypothetical protein